MYSKILKDINDLLDKSDKDIIWVAIDGPAASGKSTMGNFLNDNFICNLFHMDDFFLPPDKKTADRLCQPGGNVDYERFKEQIIDNVSVKKSFTFQEYDCHSFDYFESGKIFPKRLNIAEGVYSMHPSFEDIFDYKIFLNVDKTTQLKRILNRSGEKLLEKYISIWLPLEENYFSSTNIKAKCDAVFDTSNMF